MLLEIEKCLSNYPNIIQTLTALGTIGAVITSLFIARLSNKIKIKSYVWPSEILHPDEDGSYYPGTGEKYIPLTIRNDGHIPIFLNYYGCFNWLIPFKRVNIMQMNYEPIFKDKPFEIEAHKTFSFVLCKKLDFVQELRKFIEENNYKILGLNFLKFEIYSNGKRIKTKIDKKLINEIIKELKTPPAEV